jgi:hypothetical protein
MDQAITVAPSGDGWIVKSTPFDNEMYFSSGGTAEAAARDLGARIVEADSIVVIEVFLRDGSLAGRYVSTSRSGRRP